VNTVQKCLHTLHMYVNAKMIPVETILGMRGGANKGEWWRE
jgi:hypothetical protein